MSIFSEIIEGRIPGRFVWKDASAVALLSNRPVKPGHTLVIPRQEIDHWLDVPPELNDHLFRVAQSVGRGIQAAFKPAKVGVAIVGLEVRHVHIHLIPMETAADLDFAKQDLNASPAALDEAARALRTALRTLGFAQTAG